MSLLEGFQLLLCGDNLTFEVTLNSWEVFNGSSQRDHSFVIGWQRVSSGIEHETFDITKLVLQALKSDASTIQVLCFKVNSMDQAVELVRDGGGFGFLLVQVSLDGMASAYSDGSVFLPSLM